MLTGFGKYKGLQIQDAPLSYLSWWKTALIEDLRACGEEISRRREIGLTEDVETKLSTLPDFKRSELLQRLEASQTEDETNQVLWLIGQKCREYTGTTV